MIRIRRFALRLILLVLAAGACATVAAEGITSQQADAILQELRNIRALLERAAPPSQPQQQAPAPDTPVQMRIGNAPVLGQLDAPVTMLEFTDLECPFCRAFHTASFDAIKRKYIDTGKVRYVSRDYPLPFHPQAQPAAKVARCAGEQGRFWEMRHALIVANPLNPETMARASKDMKLDVKRMLECVGNPRVEKAVQADIDEANALGVSGTPTFVIGRSKGDLLEGARVVGALPLATFESRIDALLAAPQ